MGFGPWMQLPDYDDTDGFVRSATELATGVTGHADGTTHTDNRPRSYYDQGELAAVWDAARSSATTSGLVSAFTSLSVEWLSAGSPSLGNLTYRADYRRGWNCGFYCRLPTVTPTLPPGAIGFEWENNGGDFDLFSKPVALEYTVVVNQGSWVDETATPDAVPNQPAWYLLTQGPGSDITGAAFDPGLGDYAFTTSGAPAEPTDVAAYGELTSTTSDLTGSSQTFAVTDFDPVTGAFTLGSQIRVAATPFDVAFTYPSPADPLVEADLQITASGGHRTDLIRWTVRPPRHRFIFNSALPECRIWPRDEGRAWPPNRRDRRGGRVGGYQ